MSVTAHKLKGRGPGKRVRSALPLFAHAEYFRDSVRLEPTFFDALRKLHKGALQVHALRGGLGVTLKRQDAERYRVDT